MPDVDASRSLLNASADYQADDWGNFGGGASLDLKATAELRRGIDLELGAQALVGLDASVAKFLAVDIHGQANAAARVRAQIQVPLDLFREAGLAVRLQAVAEAAAGIELGIGLDIGDFLALAESDPRMQGVPLRLVKIFLDEAKIEGGVFAKAAAAAMAYANLAATGRLVDTADGKAGFTVSAEAGAGLKAGAGFRVFARFGLDDPSRMIRRTVDVLVDDTLQRIAERTADAAVLTMVEELKAPAKMALRACFELGSQLARNGGAFNAADAPVIAQRCVQVVFEEGQRYVLGKIAEIAFTEFNSALRTMGFDANAWNSAEPERLALARRLRDMAADPFEPNQPNRDYWSAVIDEAIALARKLGARNQHTEPFVMPLAALWAAVQLLFVSVQRISSGGGRASLLGTGPNTRFPPFAGPTLQSAPPLVRSYLASLLPPGAAPRDATLEDLVAMLTAGAILDPLVGRVPALRVLVDIVGGPGASTGDAVRTLMNNLGPFVAQGGGAVDPQASLERVLAGLQRYVTTRMDRDVVPALHDLLGNAGAETRIFLDEVLVATLRFATGVIFTEAAQWARGNDSIQKAMRECCSALLMQLLGRTLVVTADVLLLKALQMVSGAFLAAVPELNRRDGAVDKLASLVPLDRNAIKDAVEEIFGLAADVFKPLPDDKRARIRELMYEVIDTTPTDPDRAFLEQLRNDGMIPNVEAATALALELGGIIAENFTRLVTRILQLLAEAMLAALEAAIAAVEHEIAAWIGEIEGLIQDLGTMIEDVLREIAQLEQQVEAAADALLDKAEAFLGVIASGHRGQLRTAVKAEARDACLSVLAGIPGYHDLPREVRKTVRSLMDDAIGAALDHAFFDDLADALAGLAGEVADFLEDARAIDPSDDVAGALVDLLVDRIEDLLRDAFGATVGIRVRFTLHGLFDVDFDLGTVGVRTSDLVHAIRGFARGLNAVTSAAHELAQALVSYLGLEQQLDLAEVERDNARAQRSDADALAREARMTGSLQILQPGAAAAYGGDIAVEIALMDVPGSFLGVDAHVPARIQVFVDETPVALSSFDVVEGVPAKPANALARLDGPVTAANPLLGRSLAPARARQSSIWTPAPSTQARVPEHAKRAVGRVSNVGTRPVSAVIHAATPGRRPRPSVTGKLVAEAQPAFTLRTVIVARDIGEGFHTLTVTLTTGSRSSRVSQSVAFYVGAAAAAPRVPSGGRAPMGKLPTRPAFPADQFAPALRPLVPKPLVPLPPPRKPPAPSTRLVRTTSAAAIARTSEALVAEATAKSAQARAVRESVKARPLRARRAEMAPRLHEGDVQ